MLTVSRVLVRTKSTWRVEAPKGGLAATVPLPTQLWQRLLALAELRRQGDPLPPPAGQLLFRPQMIRPGSSGIHVIDNSVFRRNVWDPARAAVGLGGNPRLPKLDPRGRGLKLKDLRAFTASVLIDSGATITEGAVLLRHSDHRTTEKHYARAMLEKGNDPFRISLRTEGRLTTLERLEKLWKAWDKSFPQATKKIGISGQTNRKKSISTTKRKTKSGSNRARNRANSRATNAAKARPAKKALERKKKTRAA